MRNFTFCPMCGTAYAVDQIKGTSHHCQHCDYTFFENQSATVSGLILADRKLLLIKRAIDPGKGLWDQPGGFVEPYEKPAEAIQREIQEELGIKVEIIRLFGVYAPVPYLYKDRLQQNCDIFYLLRPLSFEIRVGDDAADFQWFSREELPADHEFPFPSLPQALADLKNDPTVDF